MLCGHWCLGGQFVALLCGHWCLAPGGDLLLLPERLLLPPLGGSRGSGHQAGHKSRDCGLPLANMVGIDLLLLPDDMVLEVHSTTGNVKDLSLPLADVVGNLSGMGNLGCPPSSSSGRARDQSGDIAGRAACLLPMWWAICPAWAIWAVHQAAAAGEPGTRPGMLPGVTGTAAGHWQYTTDTKERDTILVS